MGCAVSVIVLLLSQLPMHALKDSATLSSTTTTSLLKTTVQVTQQ